nr:hypothetical protein [Tanacetum cinerariifolium]
MTSRRSIMSNSPLSSNSFAAHRAKATSSQAWLWHCRLSHLNVLSKNDIVTMALEHNSLSPGHKSQENASHGDKTDTTSNELDLLFSPMFDEQLNGSSKVVSKSSA